MICNIDLAHVLVDEDWNPKLYDFSMITGGIFPDRMLYHTQLIRGSLGFAEPFLGWSQKSDVYAFRVVLACLMTNEYWTKEDREAGRPGVLDQLYDIYGEKFWTPYEMSWAVDSLLRDPLFFASDGFKITELATTCLGCPRLRDTMEDMVTCLLKLEVVRRNPHIFPLPPESEILFKRKRSLSSSSSLEEEEEGGGGLEQDGLNAQEMQTYRDLL